MKKFLLLIFCSCFLLPVPQVAAHGDPGAVLLALGMRKALETFAKKFELATATGKTLTVYFRDGVDTPKDTLDDFEKDGGFTERLYRIRSEKRKQQEEK